MIAAALTALWLGSAPADEVIARIDRTPITRRAFAARSAALGRGADPQRVLDTLLDEAVLADEGRRIGLASDPAITALVAREKRRIVADALVGKAAALAKPSEKELRDRFHSTADFARVQLFRYASREEALAGAKRIAEGADPVGESRRASSSQVGATDATAPYLMRSQLPAPVAEAVYGSAAGAVTRPVQVDGAWVVAKVVELAIADEQEFAKRRDAMERRAQEGVGETARRHLVAQLEARAKITIDERFLSEASIANPSPGQLARVVATVDGDPVPFSEVVAAAGGLGGRGPASHLSGSALNVKLTRSLVEERLVHAEAVRRGLAEDPGVVADCELAERGLLAAGAADRILRSVPPKQAANAGGVLRERVAALRAKASLTVDRAALARAAGQPN